MAAPRDFRDHPDGWRTGDYPMDVEGLRARLKPGTDPILADVAETVPRFVQNPRFPVGFAGVDLDLYSSTRDALRLFTLPGRKMLPHTPMYFDDTLTAFNHQFAGELLAIEEFNNESHESRLTRGTA